MTERDYPRVEEAAAGIRAFCGAVPQTAIVLGSGLGDFADTLQEAVGAPYTELPHWPASKVVGHAGRPVVGDVRGKRVRGLSGRGDFYEPGVWGTDVGVLNGFAAGVDP